MSLLLQDARRRSAHYAAPACAAQMRETVMAITARFLIVNRSTFVFPSFAKLKHLLRKRAARTMEAVSSATGEILKAFTPLECANSFENAGYAPA